MTLADYLAAGSVPPPDHALILDIATRDEVLAVQATYGNPHHQMQPVPLTDGRWGIGADVLSEASGLFAGTFKHLPIELAAAVEVVSWEEFQALLPVPDPIDLAET